MMIIIASWMWNILHRFCSTSFTDSYSQNILSNLNFTKELFGIEIKINSLNDFKASVFETWVITWRIDTVLYVINYKTGIDETTRLIASVCPEVFENYVIQESFLRICVGCVSDKCDMREF